MALVVLLLLLDDDVLLEEDVLLLELSESVVSPGSTARSLASMR